MQPRLILENLPEVRRLMKSMGPQVTKELGQGFKKVGAFVISKLPQDSVGQGAGARPRPSAATSGVQIRAGGGHRSRRVQQWGKRPVYPHPQRPSIIGTAEQHQDEVEEMLLDEIEDVLRRNGVNG